MRRRQFVAALSVGGLAALAGCAEPNSSLRLIDVDDAALADRYASPVDGLPPELRGFVVDVIEGRADTREGTTPPIDRTLPVEYEGAYYRLEYEMLETHPETIYVVDVDYDPARPVDGPTVAYDDLPPADREALDDLFPPPEERPTGEGYDVGKGHRYPPDAESVLVPDSEYAAVSNGGEAYPIRVERGQDVDVHTYDYAAERVAGDASELAAQARDRYRFVLTGLSSGEREIVESAIENDYRVDADQDPPEAFGSLIDRFRNHTALRRDEYGGDWLARYDASDYWADVSFPPEWQTTDDGTPPATPPPE